MAARDVIPNAHEHIPLVTIPHCCVKPATTNVSIETVASVKA